MLILNRVFILVVLLLAVTTFECQAQPKPFELHGIYLEGCTCKVVCPCDLLGGMVKGCQVMGAMIITTGKYGDADLGGTIIAAAVGDKWVRIYIRAKDQPQSEAAGNMARGLFSPYGKIEVIRDAEIKLSGSNGSYTLEVNGGEVLHLQTEPVLGADGKTAVTYTNYPDPLFHTIMQGKTVSGRFNDGGHRFILQGTNSFFNPDWSIAGNI